MDGYYQAPIMSMWAREDFSIMFPATPNFHIPLAIVIQRMISTAGQLEEKLLGVSAANLTATLLGDQMGQSGVHDSST